MRAIKRRRRNKSFNVLIKTIVASYVLCALNGQKNVNLYIFTAIDYLEATIKNYMRIYSYRSD